MKWTRKTMTMTKTSTTMHNFRPEKKIRPNKSHSHTPKMLRKKKNMRTHRRWGRHFHLAFSCLFDESPEKWFSSVGNDCLGPNIRCRIKLSEQAKNWSKRLSLLLSFIGISVLKTEQAEEKKRSKSKGIEDTLDCKRTRVNSSISSSRKNDSRNNNNSKNDTKKTHRRNMRSNLCAFVYLASSDV